MGRDMQRASSVLSAWNRTFLPHVKLIPSKSFQLSLLFTRSNVQLQGLLAYSSCPSSVISNILTLWEMGNAKGKAQFSSQQEHRSAL